MYFAHRPYMLNTISLPQQPSTPHEAIHRSLAVVPTDSVEWGSNFRISSRRFRQYHIGFRLLLVRLRFRSLRGGEPYRDDAGASRCGRGKTGADPLDRADFNIDDHGDSPVL